MTESPGRSARLSELWRTGAAAVLVLAAVLRLYDLDRKPFHHDEGVNGFFLTKLVRQGVYQYDPENYHGPTLYYLAAGLAQVMGLETPALRGVTALAGIAVVALALGLHPFIGRWGALAAAALLAASPGAVYFSRYFIHETLVVLFTFGVVAAGLRVGSPPRPAPLLLAVLSAALLFATKETAGVHVAILGIAWALAGLLAGGPRVSLERGRREIRLGLAGVALFALVNALLYSSFFTHLRGIPDAFRSLAVWSRTGTSAHVNPWHQHLTWIWAAEPTLLVLGACGVAVALWRRDNRAALLVSFWALGMLSVYSLVPYKTPWLGLNATLPLGLVGGYALGRLAACGRVPAVLAAVTTVAVGAITAREAASLSLSRFDDEVHAYVYAHTHRRFTDMVTQIHRLARSPGQGSQLAVTITSPEHWPLPWYLRDYERAGYYGRIPETIDGLVVVGSTQQQRDLQVALGARYRCLGRYPLRPGVDLVLFAHQDLPPQ